MSEILQPDSQFCRSCILYEALHKKPVNEAFKHMKKVMPDLDYVDFEYWYFRFLSGNHDLNHDRSTDPETFSFSDMPIDVAQKIVDKLDLVDKLITRNVSHGLREVIDKTEIDCNYFNVCFLRNSAIITGNDVFKKEYKAIAPKNDHLGLVLRDLSVLLKNPKRKIQELEIEFKENYSESSDELKRIKSMLGSSEIHVEDIWIGAPTLAPMVALIPHFKTDVLESITLVPTNMDRRFLNQIVEMDQWKNVKQLIMNYPDWFPIEHMFHVRKLSSDYIKLSRDRLIKIRDVFLKSPSFESCSLTVSSETPDSFFDEGALDEPDFTDVFDDIRRVFRVRFEYNRRSNRYAARYSDSITIKVEITLDSICLDIKKKPAV